jgi:hypothetical protein
MLQEVLVMLQEVLVMLQEVVVMLQEEVPPQSMRLRLRQRRHGSPLGLLYPVAWRVC